MSAAPGSEHTGARSSAGRDLRVQADVFAPCALGAVINPIAGGSGRVMPRRPTTTCHAGDRAPAVRARFTYAPYYVSTARPLDVASNCTDPARPAHTPTGRGQAARRWTLDEILARSKAERRPSHALANEIAKPASAPPEAYLPPPLLWCKRGAGRRACRTDPLGSSEDRNRAKKRFYAELFGLTFRSRGRDAPGVEPQRGPGSTAAEPAHWPQSPGARATAVICYVCTVARRRDACREGCDAGASGAPKMASRRGRPPTSGH